MALAFSMQAEISTTRVKFIKKSSKFTVSQISDSYHQNSSFKRRSLESRRKANAINTLK